MRIIGKIPTLPEFVTQRTFGPPFESLENWLEVGIGYCHVEQRALFDAHFEQAIPHAFVWQPMGQAPIIGIAFPSGDSVGRRFPLVICTDVIIPGFSAQLAPVALGDFLEDIFMMSGEITSLSDRVAIAQRATQVRMPMPDDFVVARREYAEWADGTPQREAWARLVDGETPEKTGPARAVAVIEALRQRGLVRIPLARGAAGGAAFWIQVVERAIGFPYAAFWAIDGSSIFISTSDPGPVGLAALFLPMPNIEPDWPSLEIESDQPSSVPNLLCEEDAPVSSLIVKLSGNAPPS